MYPFKMEEEEEGLDEALVDEKEKEKFPEEALEGGEVEDHVGAPVGVKEKVEMGEDGEEEERGVDDGSDNDVDHDGDDGDEDIVSWLRPKPPMQNPLVPKFLLRLLRHYLQLMLVKWI